MEAPKSIPADEFAAPRLRAAYRPWWLACPMADCYRQFLALGVPEPAGESDPPVLAEARPS